jgi:long-chain acyl-CoA synthetase
MNAFDFFFENTRDLKKPFVLGPKETISYNDLYKRSVMLAGYLNAKAARGQNILLIGPNSVFFIICYLAILKSGNIAVPINPEIEQSNLDFIQTKCQSNIAFLSERLAGKLHFSDVTLLNEKSLNKIFENESFAKEVPSDTPPDHLAEIIFTSGSTGESKGVMISHKNLVANTSSIVEYLQLTRFDVMLVVLPFYYCYGLSLLHTHLRVGGSIVLNNVFIMLGGVINDLKRFKCTGFAGVPSHFQILLRKSDSFKKTVFPHLRYVTQAGGKLYNPFIQEFLDTFPEIRFNVMYGQTEATARLSWLPPENLPKKIGSCGKAIPGVELMVADEHDSPVKPGETGEILARGDNIMLGYYKDTESTSHTIVNGWLRTGDLATVDTEGYIYLTARKKEIIKVGGRRISLKEIEDVIVSMPEVIDCSIISIPDDILGETMKAKVIVTEMGVQSTAITSDTIRAWCAARLALFKVPQFIEVSNEVRISSTGKKIKAR